MSTLATFKKRKRVIARNDPMNWRYLNLATCRRSNSV